MEEALQSLALEVGEARSADAVLGRIVRGLAALENVALARVWLIAPGDICESCRMRPDCPDQVRCLHLAASAGAPIASQEDWSRLTGDFRRIPLNVRKVGEIGGTGAPILIGENLAESHWIARPQWARSERIVSFAGQPLIFRGEILGVLAVFSRGAIPLSTFKWLRIFADHAAIAISNARAFDEIGRLRRALEQERDYLREEVREALSFGEIIGGSGALRDVLEQVALVAPTDATVLILGESGTGKELIASALHQRSLRRNGPLVRVNCGSIPGELFESEFFGHARGSFTGALRDREGRFQLADGGTLFLDEVGEIPVPLQAKLLRVLQEGQFERVGEEKTRKVSVRVIAATNRDLGQEAENGRFRRDLYYWLNVFPMQLPPLRERKEDIPALAGHFMRLACAKLNRPDLHLTDDEGTCGATTGPAMSASCKTSSSAPSSWPGALNCAWARCCRARNLAWAPYPTRRLLQRPLRSRNFGTSCAWRSSSAWSAITSLPRSSSRVGRYPAPAARRSCWESITTRWHPGCARWASDARVLEASRLPGKHLVLRR
jgi:GAF domain-containing protein